MRKNWGWVLVIVTALFPIILWMLAAPINTRFTSASVSILSLSQICALTGASFFAWNFILAARLRWLESGFGGLNKVFVAHHTFGGVAFVLLLLHAILVMAQYLPISISLTGEMLIDVSDLSKNLGRLTLGIIMTVLIITYYFPLKHNTWKWTHQIIGAALFTGFAHVFIVPSDVANYLPLRYWMLGILLSGIIAYCYRVLFGRYLVSRYKYTVTDIKKFPNNIMEIVLTPTAGSMQYRPGQFVFISFIQNGITTEFHPFSITSDSSSKQLSIGIKRLGDYTETLSSLERGTEAKIEGPFGRFYIQKNHHADQIWVAGGIGITPFLSMIRSQKVIDGGKVWLFYSVNTIDEAVFLPELIAYAKENEDFILILHETKRNGYISAEIISKKVGELTNKEIFLCGPPPMMKSLRGQFVSIGVNNNVIHSEEFTL